MGVALVQWTQEGLKDPVIANVRPRTVVAQWHQDTFEPVPGAALLASSERYTQQAFRLGESYGFQFHLELSAEILERWIARHADALGQDARKLRTRLPELEATQAELTGLRHRLANHFAKAVR
jgi:GMP synthase (glutamine-hydrolysing)